MTGAPRYDRVDERFVELPTVLVASSFLPIRGAKSEADLFFISSTENTNGTSHYALIG